MSEVTRLSHPRLVEIEEFLLASRAGLLAAAQDVPVDRWGDPPNPATWSAAQVLDHLRIVEHGIVRLVQKLAREARAAGHPAEKETTSVVDPAFVARTNDRARRLEAPPRVMPVNAPDRQEALAAIARERAELLAAMAEADGLALGKLSWSHPVIGPLNLYEWLVFVGAHEMRHTAQLQEIAAAVATR